MAELGGIGIVPQTPAPPFLIFEFRCAAASGLSLYILDTSIKDGPIFLVVIVWHASQEFFIATVGMPSLPEAPLLDFAVASEACSLLSQAINMHTLNAIKVA